MTIVFGSDTLAAAGREGVTAFSLAHTRVVQEADLIRAEAPFQVDRKNRTVEVSFSNAKEHADLATAELYLLDLETGLAGQADLTFTIGVSTRVLEDALLVGLQLGQNGVTTFHSYTFRGGYLITPPAA